MICTNNIDSFNLASYRENYSVQGVGVNARLGVILKASDRLKAGLSVSTPTLYGLREITTGRMFTDLEEYFTAGGSTSEADEHTIYTDSGADIPELQLRYGISWKFIARWILYDQRISGRFSRSAGFDYCGC